MSRKKDYYILLIITLSHILSLTNKILSVSIRMLFGMPGQRDEQFSDEKILPKSIFTKGIVMPIKNDFDIACLESETLKRLFHETTSYMQNVTIQVIANRRGERSQEEHPATTTGLVFQRPVIQIADWLGEKQRIEAIAHELAHLLMVYRCGLGVVGRKIPRPGDSGSVFRFFMSMRGDWIYLLGQIPNTAHHLILLDYLKEEYGIEDNLHTYLLDQNFRVAANDNARDRESQYGLGLVAFEYERLIGKFDKAINIDDRSEFFWEAYRLAHKHFGGYSFHSIPNAASYQEDILSFLGDIGYQREDFMFFPE